MSTNTLKRKRTAARSPRSDDEEDAHDVSENSESDQDTDITTSSTKFVSAALSTQAMPKSKQHPIIQLMYDVLVSMKSKLMFHKFKKSYPNAPPSALTMICDHKMLNTQWHEQGYELFVTEFDVTRSLPKGEHSIPLTELKAIDKRNPFKVIVVPLKRKSHRSNDTANAIDNDEDDDHKHEDKREWCPGWILPPKEFFALHTPKPTETEYESGPLSLSHLAKVRYSSCPNFYEQRFYFWNPECKQYNIRLETIIPKELRIGISKANLDEYTDAVETFKTTELLTHDDNDRRKKKLKRVHEEHHEMDNATARRKTANSATTRLNNDNRNNATARCNTKDIDAIPTNETIVKLKSCLGIQGNVNSLADLAAFQPRRGIFARFHTTGEIEREYQDQLNYLTSLTSKIQYELEQQTEFCFLVRSANVLHHQKLLQDNLKKQYDFALHKRLSHVDNTNFCDQLNFS